MFSYYRLKINNTLCKLGSTIVSCPLLIFFLSLNYYGSTTLILHFFLIRFSILFSLTLYHSQTNYLFFIFAFPSFFQRRILLLFLLHLCFPSIKYIWTNSIYSLEFCLLSKLLLHLNILICDVLIICSTFLSIAQYSDTYNVEDFTSVLQNLLFHITRRFLSHKIPDTSL